VCGTGLKPGFFGTASTNEALFGCLEYLPVILALIIWALFSPGSFFRHSATDDNGRHTESSRERKIREKKEKSTRGASV
jgi:hypothetical protein